MVQWSPPDVRLTVRGQTTKRKYTLNSPKYTYKYHCITKHECCSVYLIFTNHTFHGLYLLYGELTVWGNVSQRVIDRIESWFSRCGYINTLKIDEYAREPDILCVSFGHLGCRVNSLLLSGGINVLGNAICMLYMWSCVENVHQNLTFVHKS